MRKYGTRSTVHVSSCAVPHVSFIAGVPNPGLPAEYPRYLKPIPVNSRSIEAALRAAVARGEQGLSQWLYSTWTANADAIKYQELRNALATGEIDQAWLDAWRAEYAKFVNESWLPSVRAAMTASSGLMLTGVDAPIGAFSLGTKNISDWIQEHGADLITELTAQEKKAVQSVLDWGMKSNLGTDEIAQYLRPIVGLNGPQADAVAAFRDSLIEEGMEESKIIRRVEDYAAWLNRQRAATIAQTEISNAFREGQLESMQQLIAPGGWLEGEQITKQWVTAPGCCDECAAMGEEDPVPVDQPYSNGLMTAGLHPHCYCIDEYARVRDQAEAVNE